MARFFTANDVINRAALECGIVPVTDPYSSTDETFVQLSGLLNSAGQEMVELHPWQGLRQKWTFTTMPGDTGSYDLPDDFSYMIDQTGWNKSDRLPIGGPLSSQVWAFMDGLELLDQPLYMNFQIEQNKLELWPQNPLPTGIDIAFQYQSRNWAQNPSTEVTSDVIAAGSDLVKYEPILIIKMLKAMFLSAKGFDASAARLEFETMFLSRTGKDAGAPILNASTGARGVPLLSANNAPWTGYGP